jgi:hypothetical protein
LKKIRMRLRLVTVMSPDLRDLRDRSEIEDRQDLADQREHREHRERLLVRYQKLVMMQI